MIYEVHRKSINLITIIKQLITMSSNSENIKGLNMTREELQILMNIVNLQLINLGYPKTTTFKLGDILKESDKKTMTLKEITEKPFRILSIAKALQKAQIQTISEPAPVITKTTKTTKTAKTAKTAKITNTTKTAKTTETRKTIKTDKTTKTAKTTKTKNTKKVVKHTCDKVHSHTETVESEELVYKVSTLDNEEADALEAFLNEVTGQQIRQFDWIYDLPTAPVESSSCSDSDSASVSDSTDENREISGAELEILVASPDWIKSTDPIVKPEFIQCPRGERCSIRHITLSSGKSACPFGLH